ncbi:MAG: hypothetical protein Q8Q50_00420 [Methylobacter sp.]|nr:hypothetical protein [Methylobacter sp.]
MSRVGYSVTYFVATVVVSKHPFDGYGIAPLVGTYEQARDMLTPFIVEHPDSYIQQITELYSSENDRDRQEVLASIVTDGMANKAKSQA